MAAVGHGTPGVYVQEPDFPPSVVGVETAVPAFIGYTEKAVDESGSSLRLVAKRIASMVEFSTYFGGATRPKYTLTTLPPPAAVSSVAGGSTPAAVAGTVAPKQRVSIADRIYELTPSPAIAHLYLYDSLRLFYASGGGACYIVSCGSHAEAVPRPKPDDLLAGLAVCGNLVGPTMLVVPDALLLSSAADHANVALAMLEQCRDSADRIALIDVFGSDKLPPQSSADVASDLVGQFRQALMGATTPDMLKYGAAYFPSLATSLISASDIDLSFFDLPSLAEALDTAVDRAIPPTVPTGGGPVVSDPNVQQIEDSVTGKIRSFKPASPADPVADGLVLYRLDQSLLETMPVYGAITSLVAKSLSVLPSSAAMAGIYTVNDATRGVWNAPANVNVIGAPTIPLTSDEEDELVAPINGMAVNPIRTVPGSGSLVWGARTLDGNSEDSRYIQVRRTMIYVEQSVKAALMGLIFQSNRAQTWAIAISMIDSFLHGLWAAGGLMGASPAEAYSVTAGLGTTMTSQDVLSGTMRVAIAMQMIKPAEFIELTFEQKMAGGA